MDKINYTAAHIEKRWPVWTAVYLFNVQASAERAATTNRLVLPTMATSMISWTNRLFKAVALLLPALGHRSTAISGTDRATEEPR